MFLLTPRQQADAEKKSESTGGVGERRGGVHCFDIVYAYLWV